MFNAFVSTCEVSFRTTHEHNKTRRFDTEGFVPPVCALLLVHRPELPSFFLAEQ